MAAEPRPTPLALLLRERYARFAARGGSPEILAAETGLHEETIRKYRTGEIQQPAYRGLVLLAMALGIDQNELEISALSENDLYHKLLRRHHLREAGVLATRVDDAYFESLQPSFEHTIRRLMAALHETVQMYEALAPPSASLDPEQRAKLVQAAEEAQVIARRTLSYLDDPSVPLAGAVQATEEADAAARVGEALGGISPEEEHLPRDEDEPQPGQSG